MNALKLIARSAAFYWRTHLGVAAGAAVASAVLVGALVVGDSVRHSLRQMALRRLGDVHAAMSGWDRFFRARPDRDANDLAADVAAELNAPVASVLLLDGSAKTPDGSARANRVQVVGVDERFWAVGGAADPLAGAADDEVLVNAPLAEQLGLAGAGGEEAVVLRVRAPSGLPKDAPLAREKDAARGFRVTVRAVVGEEHFGRFSLRANQLAPFTVFLRLSTLQEKVNLRGRANVLLVGPTPKPDADVADLANGTLRKHWRLADADLRLRRLSPDVLELRTGRVFLDEPVSKAAAAAGASLRILTYFVDEVRLGERASPYCIVAAIDPNRPAGRADTPAESPLLPPPPSPVPLGLSDDQVVLNEWLARDIGAKAGDRVEMTYSTLGPMRKFVRRSRTFRVHSVVPIRGSARDPDLMPDFPGLAGMKSCHDWDPGLDIDLKKLKDPDDKYNKYWQQFRGTPKAFVTLAAGRDMWANRFGDLTAVRYRVDPQDPNAERDLAGAILGRLDPAAIGLYFLPVRRQALAAAEPTSDFGGLFLGLSFFLIASAVLLTGLLFVFGVEQRSQQTGTLLALGFRPWRVRGWLLAEGGVLAVVGCGFGAAGGLAYTRGVLHALATVWAPVSTASPIRFHAEPATVALGGAIGAAVALGAMLAALVLQGRATARELLAAGAEGRASRPASRGRLLAGTIVGVAGIVLAGGLVVLASAGAIDVPGAFFGSGGLLLIGSLSLCYVLLGRLGRGGQEHVPDLTHLGVRTCGRRRWRSLTTAGLLASGMFLVASVEVFRLDPGRNAGEHSSGTGGFALYGESALPILHDLNDPDRRERLGLDDDACRDARAVQIRVHEGDDASCLNLNRAQRPRVLGVDPARLAGRFTFAKTLGGDAGDGWALLNGRGDDGAVPAIGDHDTLRWALHKAVGETVSVTDERGREVRLRLVGEIGGSIFQGNLLIAERRFAELFPSNSGYRALLIDADPASADGVRKAFTSALEDFGLELTGATRRLAMFMEVQNTYLSIFAALGGLGLLLGSVAMGVVVLRNVLERRGELALLRAVGFTRGQLRWLVLCEHWTLLALGLACGAGSAVVAVVPALGSPDTELPYASWLATLGGVLASGVAWTYLAATVALRGELLEALRRE